MSLSPTDRLILSVVERVPSVSRRRLAHLTDTAPMTVSRAVDRLIRAGFLAETHGVDAASGRHGRLITLNPTLPLLWLDLSKPRTSVTALVTDSLLRPLCRIEHRYSDLYDDEDNLRRLFNDLRRHPAASLSLAATDVRLGIAVTPPDGVQDAPPLLREILSDLFPLHHLTVLPREAAVTAACLHAVPLDCKQVLYVQTGNSPHAATLRIERSPNGAMRALPESESVLTATLAQYLQDGTDDAVSRFVRDYRRFHAPSPAVWVSDSPRHAQSHPTAEDVIRLSWNEAVSRGSLTAARRALWEDMLRHHPDKA